MVPTKSLMEQFMADAEVEIPNDIELNEIVKLASDQRNWENRIATLEEQLETAKESLRQVQEYLLPEAMTNMGLSEFKMVDGSKITIRDDVYASIRKDKLAEAVEWLGSIGLGDIVKDKVDVAFGRGQANDAEQLLSYCRQMGFNASETLSVHPQTLKATVKEQMARGVEFPEEYFSTGPLRKAIIKSK